MQSNIMRWLVANNKDGDKGPAGEKKREGAGEGEWDDGGGSGIVPLKPYCFVVVLFMWLRRRGKAAC
jgi:hypothetical protein